MDRRKELLARVYLVFILFVILSLVIIARVFKVAILEGEKWREKGHVNLEMRPIYSERGNIYSEDLNLLSTSLQFFDIHMDLTVVDNKVFRRDLDSLAYYLSRTIGSHKTKAAWKQDLAEAKIKKKQYYRIARNINIEEYNKVKRFPIFRRGQLRGGFIASKSGRRVKPFKGLAARTIGIHRDKNPVGLEGAFNKVLAGESKPVLMKRVSTVHNIWVPVYEVDKMEPMRGQDIVTTLNVNIQDIVHEEMLKRANELDAEKAVCVVMETNTGAIKAITNLMKYSDGYAESRNLAIAHLSDPGSTMKLASTMAMIDDGYCDLSTKVNLNNGKLKIYDRYLRDDHAPVHNLATLKEAFEQSSNVGIGRLAHEYYNNSEGRRQFIDKYRQFGLVETTGIEIEGEGKPVIKDPVKDAKNWSGITVPWMAHGYEMRLTPLEILAFYNSVANNGRRMRPYLVSDIIDDTRTIKHFNPEVVIDQVAKPSTIRDMKKLLRGVVLEGTGKSLQSDIVDISGKTGTTVVNYTNKEHRTIYNASFAGYFPSELPKYTMIVVFYDPKGRVYGSSAAGPAFKKIAERISILSDEIKKEDAPRLASNDLPEANAGFSPDFKQVFDYVGLDYKEKKKSRWVEVDPFESQMLIDKKDIEKKYVPNIKGMGARDAIYVLEKLGMHVEVEGVGKVVKQSIRPGEKNKGQNIKIYLN